MRTVMAGVAVVLLAGAAGAQGKIPPKELVRIGRALAAAGKKLEDVPVRVDLDAGNADGARRGERRSAVVLPQKGLSAEALEKAGDGVLPLGHLWMRKLTVVTENKPTPAEMLRIVTVRVGRAEHDRTVFLLGVRAAKGAGLEMLVFAKEKTPLLVVPLKPIKVEQEKPVELEARRSEAGRATLKVKVLGRYQAEVPIAVR